MKKLNLLAIGAALCLAGCKTAEYKAAVKNDLRAPAYPLVTIDPYTSAWSTSDELYGSPVKHWTGREMSMLGVIKVDGECYRFMGEERIPMKQLLKPSEREAWEAVYTFEQPKGNWTAVEYDDIAWKKGVGAFGTEGEQATKTVWEGEHVWVRRVLELDESDLGKPLLMEYSHDDDCEMYINGVEILNSGNTTANNRKLQLPEEAMKVLKPGKNIIAVHCHNRVAAGYLDFCLWEKQIDKSVFARTATQTSANVMPTQTYYTFECGGVKLDVIFTAPLLMDNLDLMSRPVNYVTYQVASTDGKPHEVGVYFETTPQWAQHRIFQPVQCELKETAGQYLLKTGTKEQKILGRRGDDVMIDWGYFYMACDKGKTVQIGKSDEVKNQFKQATALKNSCDPSLSGDLTVELEVLAIAQDLGQVAGETTSGYILLGYDDLYAIQYFGENRRPYWNRKGDKTIEGELNAAATEYAGIMDRCADFDVQLMNKAAAVGGKKYAELCALAYRQAIAAHKLIEDKEGNLIFLSKENFSNGSIGTVDISYPSVPLFLVYNTDLAKGLMNHIFYYSESGKWTKPFAAHDIGTYPLANGQTYGGDMPVEESGNMLTMAAAVCMIDGNADYAAKHWEVMTTWANYLLEHGMDPENQLCTDDFAGHFAHNTNLSVKAIMGIAAYGKMAEMLGKKDIAATYLGKAKQMAQQWEQMAADGDHYKLTFDKAGTSSLKYNMVWDKLFKTDLFADDIYNKELAYYPTKANKYGVPLDNRADYTKSDWILWVASLTDDPAVFGQLVDPVWRYANETPSRVPISDWHMTSSGHQRGFQARSVVGGYFMPLLKSRMK